MISTTGLYLLKCLNFVYTDGCGDLGIFVNKIPSAGLQYYFIILWTLNKLKAQREKNLISLTSIRLY